MIKCILFDLGGVIIDYADDRYYYPYLAKISGVPMRKVMDMIENRMEVPLDKDTILQKDFNEAVADRLGIRPSQVMWYEIYEKRGKPDRGTLGVVRRLRKNYSVSYLSNVDRSRYSWSVKLLRPYLKLFDHRLASCEIRLRKPSAAVYKYALKRMRLKSSEVVFVDNLLINVRGARRAGIKSILFTSSKDLERKLRKMGVRI